MPIDMTQLKGVDFNTGDSLGVLLFWVPDDLEGPALLIKCGTGGKTTISSPSADPGYPVPEMGTLALFSVGLLALVGYVAYRRRGV